jgi:arylsulfatase
LACGGERGDGSSASRENLVLVVVDTLRADHLGLYGYARDTSPRLDAFARDAVVFERAQSASPWTAPSLISLMTSLHPEAHGVRTFPSPAQLSERVVTLAELLRDRGYATAAFTEGGYAKGAFGLDQGFDVYPEYEDDGVGRLEGYPSRIENNLERSIEWLQDHRHEPFFMFFHTYEVHAPWRAPEAWIRRFRPDYDERAEHERLDEIVGRWRRSRALDAEAALLVQQHTFHCRLEGQQPVNVVELLAAIQRRGFDRSQRFRAGLRAWLRDVYDAEIAYTDAALQRLWDALSDEDLVDQTTVVVTSDHGEGLGDHGEVHHGAVLHEEALRVPLILRLAGPTGPPRRIGQMVRSIDVMPTLLEVLDVPADGLPLQGRSLLPLLSQEGTHEPAYSQTLAHGRVQLHSVVKGPWRLVVNEASGAISLYDHSRDPTERIDLAPSRPKVVEELRSLLEQQRKDDRRLAQDFETQPADGVISEQLRRELRALGYLDEAR